MNRRLFDDISRFLTRKKVLRTWRKALAGLAAGVVFVTSVMMINPAIATILDPGQGSDLLPVQEESADATAVNLAGEAEAPPAEPEYIPPAPAPE